MKWAAVLCIPVGWPVRSQPCVRDPGVLFFFFFLPASSSFAMSYHRAGQESVRGWFLHQVVRLLRGVKQHTRTRTHNTRCPRVSKRGWLAGDRPMAIVKHVRVPSETGYVCVLDRDVNRSLLLLPVGALPGVLDLKADTHGTYPRRQCSSSSVPGRYNERFPSRRGPMRSPETACKTLGRGRRRDGGDHHHLV